jgi:hypothetical protein
MVGAPLLLKTARLIPPIVPLFRFWAMTYHTLYKAMTSPPRMEKSLFFIARNSNYKRDYGIGRASDV